ncbi:putative splicing factor SF3a60 binding domain, SF3A3 domain, splicing factor 3A subunit 3 [Helianthus annuus]|uniref:Splicing factor SF3a60 binding domain, SF3A3 domain, splicing factor 3A subunit 3 n=1 Tax=Helianthus annuus TaxID=4232 RepID=A0A9K3N7U1_HELAN|nr:putative splicing factor SF3a60 binding domain, SF3A3 domain, splicing factor 3A subunit 3 [Helianthus annuus]
MSWTLLELTRAAHEDVEQFETLIVKDLQNEPASNKARLYQTHRIRYMIDQITSTTHKLVIYLLPCTTLITIIMLEFLSEYVEIYEDKDNARKDEIAALGGQITATGTNVFSAFYDRLKEIREYHRGRHPSAARVLDSEQLLEEEPHIQFRGEEAYGRYLDLHELYNDYINSKFGKQIDYSTYLEVFSQPQRIPSSKLQATRQYKEYLRKLTGYLVYFLERIEPLRDLDRLFSKVTTEFEEQWANGKVDERKDDAQENTSINLDYYSTIEELVELGPEKLKKALVALGLKAGGTVQQRAERLFLTKHTPLENLDKRHFAKGARRPEQNNVKHQNDDPKQIALMEVKLEKLCEILSEKIIQTRKNVERKQGLTSKEIEAEMEDEDVADMEIDDENQQVYNPLKFPMGWDGRQKIKYK